MLGQPLDYVATVAKGMTAYVAPAGSWHSEGSTWDHFFHTILFDPNFAPGVQAGSFSWYGAAGQGTYVNDGYLDAMLGYETATQPKGPFFVGLALLSLLGVALARGVERRTAAVVFALAWVSLIAPVATVWWDARLAIPGIQLLAASAAIGAVLTTRRVRAAAPARARPRVGPQPGPEPVRR